MTGDLLAGAAPRRLWLDRLIADPVTEMRLLAEGRARIHPLGRAEPSDAAATVLFGLEDHEPELRAFDQGVLAALSQYRLEFTRATGVSRDRIMLAVMALVVIVQRMAPRKTVIDLHRRFAYWNAFFESLVVDRSLDLRREYSRALALTQETAAEAGLPPRRLLSFWLDMCGEAGPHGRYDENYLTVGLIGLRRLPLGEESANEEAVLNGLVRWAVRQRPSKKRFLREWHVIESAYPHDPTFWDDLVPRILDSAERAIAEESKGAHTTFDVAAWWREDVEVPKGRPIASQHQPPEMPSHEERERLLSDLRNREPFQSFKPKLWRYIERHRAYAERTGHTSDVVRSSCNFGMRLLRPGDAPLERAAYANELARLALHFERSNAFAWSLWRDALAAQGYLEKAEEVGWEALRQFPEDPQWYTQLAGLLSKYAGRVQDSRALLNEAIRLFPYHVPARNQLAELLDQQLDIQHQAKVLLRETIDKFPDDVRNNVIARTILARILGRDPKNLSEAIKVLDGALTLDPDDQIAKNARQRFAQGKLSSRPRITMLPHLSDPSERLDFAAMARARRALFRVRANETEQEVQAAKAEIENLLSGDEGSSYTRYAAAAAGVIQPSTDDTTISAAFLAAARAGSAAALHPFLQRAHGIERIVVAMAETSTEDDAAKAEIRTWLNQPANDLLPREAALRVVAEKVGSVSDEFAADMLAASLGLVPIAA